jgi:hypothetical protein
MRWSLTIRFTLVLTGFHCMICQSFAQKNLEDYFFKKNLVSGQQLKEYRKKLNVEYEYVALMARLMRAEDKKYARELEQQLEAEKKQRSNNKDSLGLLYEILSGSSEPVYYNSRKLSDDERKLLEEYAGKLLTSKLIGSRITDTMISFIRKGYILDSSGLVSNARGIKTKSESTSDAKIKKALVLFKNIGVINPANFEKLSNKPIPDSVNKIKFIVSNFEKVFIPSQVSGYTGGKEELLKNIDALGRLTGIKIEEPAFSLIQLEAAADYRAIPVIEVKYEGRKFTHLSYEVTTTVNNPDPYALTGHDYYRIFNKILAYKRSPYRLYTIEENQSTEYYYTYWTGFILLAADQRNALYRNELIDLSLETNLPALSYPEVKRAIGLYQETGLLDQVSQVTIDSLIQSLEHDPVFRYNELISRFTPISVTIEERLPINEEQAMNLLQRLSDISGGEFKPVNPRVGKNAAGELLLMFEYKGKTYREQFLSGWRSVWSPVHDAVFGDLERKAQFESLRFEQYKETFIYISPEKLKRLEKEGVISDY